MLPSIRFFGAGQLVKPRLALVFVNPTHRNIATHKTWSGLKAPWIGCSNIWQLFADAQLISESVNNRIQRSATNWSPVFAREVYAHVQERGLYITNIIKWAGLDAQLPDRAKVSLYAPLLIEELGRLRDERIIAFGQLTYEAVLRELHIKGGKPFGAMNEDTFGSKQLSQIETAIGVVTPCYFPVGQGIRNRPKAIEILKLAQNKKVP